jgi:hypothetical protein
MQEHQGSVIIPMAGDPAGTLMHPFGQGLFDTPAAAVTGLRGLQSPRRCFHVLASRFFLFISQHLQKQAWCGTQDFPIESTFATSTVGGHRLDRQPLGDQRADQPNQPGGGLMQEVSPLVGNLPVQRRHDTPHLFPILRPAPLARQRRLGMSELNERAPRMAGIVDMRDGAVRQRQCGECFHAPIHSSRQWTRRSLWNAFHRDRGIPTAICMLNLTGLRFANDLGFPPNLHRTDARQPQLSSRMRSPGISRQPLPCVLYPQPEKRRRGLKRG